MNITHLSNFDAVSVVWILFCVALLLFMQAGFCCLEAGAIRSKNSINVVVKNIIDFCISLLIFTLVGFGMIFLPGNVLMGSPAPLDWDSSSALLPVFLLHGMFCASAVTIISGAVAERISLRGYISIAIVTSLVIYPLVAHWTWGATIYPENNAWLAQLGFYDFAGSTIVHSLGGWVTLAAMMVIGPRLGRFDKNFAGFEASSMPLSALGVFLLWIGWIGFNGGSALRFDENTPRILSITILAGVLGIASATFCSFIKYAKPRVMPILNGCLAGLVAVTAAADMLTLWEAAIAALVAGSFPVIFENYLDRFEIDDAIGVIPVHLMAGIWGTLFVGFVIDLQPGITRLDAITSQAIGITCIALFAFPTAYALLKSINYFYSLRVSFAAEMIGLNVWEHDANTAQLELLNQMAIQAHSHNFNHGVSVDPGSDISDIATFYNSVLTEFNELQQKQAASLNEAMWEAQHDVLTGILNRRAINQLMEKEYARIRRHPEHESSIAIIDLDHFKQVNDTYGHDIGDLVLQHLVRVVTSSLRETDVFGRIGGEEFCLMLTDTGQYNSRHKLEHVRDAIHDTPFQHEDIIINITASIGFAMMSKGINVQNTLKMADKALYFAKDNGRNRVCSLQDKETAL